MVTFDLYDYKQAYHLLLKLRRDAIPKTKCLANVYIKTSNYFQLNLQYLPILKQGRIQHRFQKRKEPGQRSTNNWNPYDFQISKERF